MRTRRNHLLSIVLAFGALLAPGTAGELRALAADDLSGFGHPAGEGGLFDRSEQGDGQTVDLGT